MSIDYQEFWASERTKAGTDVATAITKLKRITELPSTTEDEKTCLFKAMANLEAAAPKYHKYVHEFLKKHGAM